MLAMALATTIMGYAQKAEMVNDEYSGMLSVVKGEAFDDESVTVTAEKAGEASVTLTLKNLRLTRNRMVEGIGTIVIKDVPLTSSDEIGVLAMNTEGMFVIAPGSLDPRGSKQSGDVSDIETRLYGNGVGGEDQPFGNDWIGPLLGPIYFTLTGKVNKAAMELTLNMKIQSDDYNTSAVFKSGEFVTTISTPVAMADNARAYTITGMPVPPNYHGIVIIGGKKCFCRHRHDFPGM